MGKKHRLVYVLILLFNSYAVHATWRQTFLRPFNAVWNTLTYTYTQARDFFQPAGAPLYQQVEREPVARGNTRAHEPTLLEKICAASVIFSARFCIWLARVWAYFGYQEAVSQHPAEVVVPQEAERNQRVIVPPMAQFRPAVIPRRPVDVVASQQAVHDQDAAVPPMVRTRPAGAPERPIDIVVQKEDANANQDSGTSLMICARPAVSQPVAADVLPDQQGCKLSEDIVAVAPYRSGTEQSLVPARNHPREHALGILRRALLFSLLLRSRALTGRMPVQDMALLPYEPLGMDNSQYIVQDRPDRSVLLEQTSAYPAFLNWLMEIPVPEAQSIGLLNYGPWMLQHGPLQLLEGPLPRPVSSVRIELLPDEPLINDAVSKNLLMSPRPERRLQPFPVREPRVMSVPESEISNANPQLRSEQVQIDSMKHICTRFNPAQWLVRGLQEPADITNQELMVLATEPRRCREELPGLTQYWSHLYAFAAAIATNIEKANRSHQPAYLTYEPIDIAHSQYVPSFRPDWYSLYEKATVHSALLKRLMKIPVSDAQSIGLLNYGPLTLQQGPLQLLEEPLPRPASSVTIELLPDEPLINDAISSNSIVYPRPEKRLQPLPVQEPRVMSVPDSEASDNPQLRSEQVRVDVMKHADTRFDAVRCLAQRIQEPADMTEQELTGLVAELRQCREQLLALSQYWSSFDDFAATIAANTEKANRSNPHARLVDTEYYAHDIFDGLVDAQSHAAVRQCLQSGLLNGQHQDKAVMRQIGHTLRDPVGKLCYDRFINGQQIWLETIGTEDELQQLVARSNRAAHQVFNCLVRCNLVKEREREMLISVLPQEIDGCLKIQNAMNVLGRVLGVAAAELDQQKGKAYVHLSQASECKSLKQKSPACFNEQFGDYVHIPLNGEQIVLEQEAHAFFNELLVDYVHTLQNRPDELAAWMRLNGLNNSAEQEPWRERVARPVRQLSQQVHMIIQQAIAGEQLVKQLCDAERVDAYIDESQLSLKDHLQALINITWYFHACGVAKGRTFTHSGAYIVHDLKPVSDFVAAYVRRARAEHPLDGARQQLATYMGLGDHPLAYARMSSHLKHSERAGIDGIAGGDFGIDIRFEPNEATSALLPDDKRHLLFIPLADGRFLLKPEGAGTSVFDLPELAQHSLEFVDTLWRHMGQSNVMDDVCGRERVPKDLVSHIKKVLVTMGLEGELVEHVGECVRKDGGYAAAQQYLREILEKRGADLSVESQRQLLSHLQHLYQCHDDAPYRIGNEVVIRSVNSCGQEWRQQCPQQQSECIATR